MHWRVIRSGLSPACICISSKILGLDLSKYEFDPSLVPCTIELLPRSDFHRTHRLTNLHCERASPSYYNTWSNDLGLSPICSCIAPKMPGPNLSMYEFDLSLVLYTIELLPRSNCRRTHGSTNLRYRRAPPSCYSTWSNDSQGIWFHHTFQISAF